MKEAPITRTAFGTRLAAKGFDRERSSGARYRRGLVLQREPAATDHDGLRVA
jgi:hypothetical protein